MGQIIKAIAVTVAIVVGYCWVSADEWEMELAEEARTEEILAARRAWIAEERTREDTLEPDVTPQAYTEPEPVFHQYAPRAVIDKTKRTVKKSAVKAKQKIRPKRNP